MKMFKIAAIASGIVFSLISAICFINAIGYDIDAYDFGNIYKLLNPAKVFFLFAVIIFLCVFVLHRLKNGNINIEKLFLSLIVIIYICFGCAYLSSTDNNNAVIFESAINSELGHELKKKYLPYYDEYSDLFDEKGEYEIYKGESNGTIMIYVDSNILNSKGHMNYEAEYLNTKNKFIYYKYLTSKTNDDTVSSVLKGTLNIYNIDGLKVELHQDGNDYVALIKNSGRIFYVTIMNVIDILPEEFAKQCVEQYKLMELTVENGALLIFNNTGDDTMSSAE